MLDNHALTPRASALNSPRLSPADSRVAASWPPATAQKSAAVDVAGQ